MSRIAIGWVLLLMVSVYASIVQATVRHYARSARWPLLPAVLTTVVVGFAPVVFVGWALARLGVYLLGGAS